MAFQRACRGRLAGDLRRAAAHASGVAGTDQQDRPQRCTWHRANDAGGALSPGACQDAAQPEAENAADPSQTAAVEGHRDRQDLRGTLRNFGLKVGVVGALKFEARIRELVENLPDLAELVEPLLIVRRTLREQIGILHGRLLAVVRTDDVCRRLMTVPGVGPVVALTYRATVDVPARFRNCKAVGAVFGLTPSRYQSGETSRPGAISKCGDEMMRMMLYEAAHIMLVR